MTSRGRNIVVGIVALIGLGIVVWMLLLFAGRVSTLFTSPGMPISFVAERADGVSDGSQVTYKGQGIGRVTRVQLSPDNQTVIIDAQVKPPPPSNVRGVIRYASSFSTISNISLDLTGPVPGPPLQPGTRLQADFEGSGIIPRQFTDLVEDLRKQQVIKHLDETIVSLRQQAERAGNVLESVQKLIGDPKMREDLQAAITNIRTATEKANVVVSNLDKFSGNLNKLSDQGAATMSDVRVAVAKVSDTLDHFQSIAAKVDQGKGTAGMLINDPKLYQGLLDTTRDLNLTVKDLQRLIQQWEQEGATIKLK